MGRTFGRAVLAAIRGSVTAAAFLVGLALLPSLRAPGAEASRAADDDDASPRSAPASPHSERAPREQGSAPPAQERVVAIDRDDQDKVGIAVAEPVSVPFQERVHAYGTVLSLERLTALFNSSLTETAQLQAAQAKLHASQAAYQRSTALLETFATAKAQAEIAAATAQIDAAAVATAKAKVEGLHYTAVQDWGPVLGEAVIARDKLATDLVAGKARLVRLSIRPGSPDAPPRTLAFAFGSGAPIEGRFVAEAAQADARMQSLGYLYAVPATPGLVPGVSVVADLPEGSVQPGLGIPSSAVVWQAGKPWMYVRTAPERFERRAIEAARATPDGGYIVSAQTMPEAADRPLVVAGAQILLSQEMRSSIPTDGDDP